MLSNFALTYGSVLDSFGDGLLSPRSMYVIYRLCYNLSMLQLAPLFPVCVIFRFFYNLSQLQLAPLSPIPRLSWARAGLVVTIIFNYVMCGTKKWIVLA